MRTHKKLDRQILGELLRTSRKHLGWTVRRAETEFGVPYSIVNKAERGHRETYRTSADHILVLIAGYGIDFRDALVAPPEAEVFHANTAAKQDGEAGEART